MDIFYPWQVAGVDSLKPLKVAPFDKKKQALAENAARLPHQTATVSVRKALKGAK